MAIANVNSAITGSGTSPVALTAAPVADNLICVGMAATPVGAIITGVSDDGGSVYVKMGRANNTGIACEQWIAWAVGTITTITVTVGGSPTNIVIGASWYSGVVCDGRKATANGTSTAPGSLMVLSDSGSLLVSMIATSGASTATQNNGTMRQNLVQNSLIGLAVVDVASSADSQSNTTNVITSSELYAVVLNELRLVAPVFPIADTGDALREKIDIVAY